MKNKTIFFSSQKGFLMISSYLVLSTLMTLSIALWMRGMNVLSTSESARYRIEAFHLAESGLDVALTSLENDLDYTGAENVAYVKGGRTVGTYSVSVTTPDLSNPYRKRVVSTGITPDLDGQGRGQERRTVMSYVDLVPRPVFEFAVFAENGIILSGSSSVVVDSYDSRFGPYGSATARANAEVMTNSTGASAIELTGNASVKGNVLVGAGGDPSTGISLSSNSSITGTTGAAPVNKVYETQDAPQSAQHMGAVSLSSSQVLELAGGTYVFDSLDMSGKAQLQFTGPATVYLLGDSSISGNGVATSSNLPKNLTIHVAGGRTLSYSGNAQLYAGIYAPDANVSVVGNGSLYGAVIASNYSQNGNGAFHFDEDLQNQDPNSDLRAEIVSWQEQNKQVA